MEKQGYVYIITNAHRTTLYVGVTSELFSRIFKHRTHFYKGSFSDRYNIEYLVFYEVYGRVDEAIGREKQIKKWRREKKIALIESMNPEWKDLFDEMNR